MDKISIIVPVYKVEKYLNKCVESIVNQTYKNLEIILVDDGSPDRCPEMCDEWEKKDDRIKVIHKKNGGLSDARNAGLDVMTGNYVMFVDSDDFISEVMCEKLIKIMRQNDVDMSVCGALRVYEDEEFNRCENECTITLFKDEDVIAQLYDSKIEYIMTAWGKLYKKELFHKLRYPKGKLHEDEFVIHELLHNIESFAVTKEKLYYYTQRPGSIMGVIGEKNILHLMEAFLTRYEFLNRYYPQKHDFNTALYMKCLRGVYVLNLSNKKQLKLQILTTYKNLYKNLKQHNMKDFMFKNFRLVYMCLYKMRLKFKTNR